MFSQPMNDTKIRKIYRRQWVGVQQRAACGEEIYIYGESKTVIKEHVCRDKVNERRILRVESLLEFKPEM